MMYLAVTYDISANKTRNTVVKILESYGFRVQKSVFEIQCNVSQYKRLKKSLEKVLSRAEEIYGEEHENKDSVKFYVLSKVGERSLEGRIDGLWKWYEEVYFEDCLII